MAWDAFRDGLTGDVRLEGSRATYDKRHASLELRSAVGRKISDAWGWTFRPIAGNAYEIRAVRIDGSKLWTEDFLVTFAAPGAD